MERLVLSHIVDLDRIVRYGNVTWKLFNQTIQLIVTNQRIVGKV